SSTPRFCLVALVFLRFFLDLLACAFDVAARALHRVARSQRQRSDRHHAEKNLLPHGILSLDSWTRVASATSPRSCKGHAISGRRVANSATNGSANGV